MGGQKSEEKKKKARMYNLSECIPLIENIEMTEKKGRKNSFMRRHSHSKLTAIQLANRNH